MKNEITDRRLQEAENFEAVRQAYVRKFVKQNPVSNFSGVEEQYAEALVWANKQQSIRDLQQSAQTDDKGES